jgi:hypothetical protein
VPAVRLAVRYVTVNHRRVMETVTFRIAANHPASLPPQPHPAGADSTSTAGNAGGRRWWNVIGTRLAGLGQSPGKTFEQNWRVPDSCRPAQVSAYSVYAAYDSSFFVCSYSSSQDRMWPS